MKTHLSFLAAALLCTAASSPAALIFQTQNFSNVTSGSVLNWNKFDVSLGTLTQIEFSLNGTLAGTFSVTNTDAFSAVSVSDPNARLALTFAPGTGQPSSLQGSAATFTTAPVTTAASPFSIGAGGNQTFSIDPAPFTLTPFTSTNLIANAAYFSGTETFATTILRVANATRVGGDSTQSFTSAVASGTATLTYTYSTAEPIPEPGTWAAAALLVGGAAYARWRKRKVA